MLSNAAVSHPLLHFYRSSIGKKLLTGLTGVILAGFIVIHLLGNLTLLVSPIAFNRYAAGLEHAKPLVWSIEGILLLAIALHAILGIQIYINKQKARPIPYESYQSMNQAVPNQTVPSQILPTSGQTTSVQSSDSEQEPASFQTLSSRSMIWTGLTLAAFTIWHLATFKFGPRYEISLDGQTERDLSRLVIKTFQQPGYVFSYLALISLLGFHLRHGLWSALQSMGVLGKRMQIVAFGLAGIAAAAIVAGYWLVPLAIYAGLIS